MSDLLNRIHDRFSFVLERLSNHSLGESKCWEYQGQINSEGYGRITISAPDKKIFLAHRVSFAFYTGIDPGELAVCHTCDNRKCIHPDHLFLGTRADNNRDMIAKGRAAKQSGNSNNSRILDEVAVLGILDKIKKGEGNKEIAATLPVSHYQVSLIRSGKSWRELLAREGYEPEKYRLRKSAQPQGY